MEAQQLDNAKLQHMELTLLGYHIKDEIDGIQREPASLPAKLAKIEFQLNKLEAMMGFWLARQQTEMQRSPRPGETVFGDPQTTKIRYYRSGLEDFLAGPWTKYLERNLDKYQAPAAEGGQDGKAESAQVEASGPGLDDQGQRASVDSPDQSPN